MAVGLFVGITWRVKMLPFGWALDPTGWYKYGCQRVSRSPASWFSCCIYGCRTKAPWLIRIDCVIDAVKLHRLVRFLDQAAGTGAGRRGVKWRLQLVLFLLRPRSRREICGARRRKSCSSSWTTWRMSCPSCGWPRSPAEPRPSSPRCRYRLTWGRCDAGPQVSWGCLSSLSSLQRTIANRGKTAPDCMI